jgi:hypothetical protein
MVSRRIRANCARRIDLILKKQVQVPEPDLAGSSHTPSSSAVAPSIRPLNLTARIMSTLAPAPFQLENLGGIGESNDVTMPTWGAPICDSTSSSGDHDDNDLAKSDSDDDEPLDAWETLPPNEDQLRTWSPAPSEEADLRLFEYNFSPTDYDYTSGSEADVDTDTESTPVPLLNLDNLQPISPALSDLEQHVQNMDVPENVQAPGSETLPVSDLTHDFPCPSESQGMI